MLHFHGRSEYIARETAAWVSQAPTSDDWREDMRDYFSGYCLDAIERPPAGSTQRVDQYTAEPFCAPSFAHHRL